MPISKYFAILAQTMSTSRLFTLLTKNMPTSRLFTLLTRTMSTSELLTLLTKTMPTSRLFTLLMNFGRKAFKNLSKIANDCSEIASQIVLNSGTHSKRAPESIFYDFLWFLEGPGPPKIVLKTQQSWKKQLKIDVQKKNVFQHNLFSLFHRFGFQKRSQHHHILRICLENVDVVKIH